MIKALFSCLLFFALVGQVGIFSPGGFVPQHGASSPQFGAQVYTNTALFSGNFPTTVGPVTSGIAVGQRAVLVLIDDDVTGVLSSVTDPRGNTYNIDLAVTGTCTNNNVLAWIVSTNVTTAIQSGDSLTLTWSTNPNTGRFWSMSVAYLTGTASSGQPDSTVTCGSMDSFPPPITGTVTTVATKTVVIGGAWLNNAAWTIGSGTIYQATSGNVWYDYFYNNLTSSGAYTPGGTTTAAQVIVFGAAYK